MKACRGVGALVSEEELKERDAEHLKMLSEIAPKELISNIMQHLWNYKLENK